MRKGDRVALYMQNSPQFVVAFYAIQRADAAVLLVNTMNLLKEVRHLVSDSGSKAPIFGQQPDATISPLLGGEIQHGASACYISEANAWLIEYYGIFQWSSISITCELTARCVSVWPAMRSLITPLNFVISTTALLSTPAPRPSRLASSNRCCGV